MNLDIKHEKPFEAETEYLYQKKIEDLERMVKETSLENERLRVAHLDVVKTCGRLRERLLKLEALEQCGVDNWDGYSDAMELVTEWSNS